MSSKDLHTALLRPAILHILRAAGFASCKPSTLDAVTDLAGRYMLLLAQNTAHYAYEKSCTYPDHPSTARDKGDGKPPLRLPDLDDAVPTVSDVRLALAAASFFTTTSTPIEEAWQEVLRRPLSSYHPAAREKEKVLRDEQDTADVREFIDWIQGPAHQEIRRIAGLLPSEQDVAIAAGEPVIKEDYLINLKKKHSKNADGTRYAGTVLGKEAEDRSELKIEGGPGSMAEWREEIRRKVSENGKNLKRRYSQINGDAAKGAQVQNVEKSVAEEHGAGASSLPPTPTIPESTVAT